MPTARVPAMAVSLPLRMVSPLPKDKPWRSEAYRRYVASHPCFCCGIAGFSQCAHQNFGKGLSSKTDDALSFPLCCTRPGHMGCHAMFDLGLNGETRDERRARARSYTERMQGLAANDGWKLGEAA